VLLFVAFDRRVWGGGNKSAWTGDVDSVSLQVQFNWHCGIRHINNDTARVLSVNEFSGQNFLVGNSNGPVLLSTALPRNPLLFLYKHLTGLNVRNSTCCQHTCTCSSTLPLKMKTKTDERKTIRIYLLIFVCVLYFDPPDVPNSRR
jgi:hypothetical protein